MLKKFEKHIQEVDHLITHGDFRKALKIINETVKNEEIGKEAELKLLILKCMVKIILGNNDEAITIASGVLKESEKLGNVILQVEAHIWLCPGYLYTGKFKECTESVEKGLELFSTIKNISREEHVRLQAQLFYWKGSILWQFGDIEKGRELVQKTISLAEESGDEFLLANSYIYNAVIYIRTNDFKKGLEYLEKGKELAIKLSNKFIEAFYYQNLSSVHVKKYEYEQAIESHSKCLALSKEIGSTLFMGSLHEIGVLYRALFQLDKALEYFKESLNHLAFKHVIYVNIGNVYFSKYDLEQAQKYFLKSMKASEKLGEKRVLPFTLYSLIRLSIELNDVPKAREYLVQLEQLDAETDFTIVNRFYRLANIFVLKTSGEISDLVEAVKLLNSFLEEADLPSYRKLDVLYTLLEIRIKELQLSANETTLEEAMKQSIRLEMEVTEQKKQNFLANVYRLQSQLALVELDINKAIDLLDKAQVIADEIDIELLKKNISRDREKIDQQLTKFQEFQEQKIPISETVKLVSLENTVQNIKQETILEERDKETGKIIEYRKLFTIKI